MPGSLAPSSLAIEEYRALRATIRERGNLRLVIGTFTFVVWAVLAVVSAVLVSTPGPMLIPLLLLAFGFEVVNSIHVSVERIGRFLQVYYEDPSTGLPAWETVIMGHAPPAGTGATPIDPLFSGFFIVAAILNLAPVAVMTANASEPTFGGIPVELAVFGLLHVVFTLRVIQARRALRTLRQRELDAFTKAIRPKT